MVGPDRSLCLCSASYVARKIRTTVIEAEMLLREVEQAMKVETDAVLLDKLRSQKNRALKLRSNAQSEDAKREARLVESPEWRDLSSKLSAAAAECCDACADKILAVLK